MKGMVDGHCKGVKKPKKDAGSQPQDLGLGWGKESIWGEG